MFKILLSFLTMFLSQKNAKSVSPPSQPSPAPELPKPSVPAVVQNPPKPLPSNPPKVDPIDWTNPSSKVSKYFTVKEALYLPTWNRMANDKDGLNDEIKTNLVALFAKMDLIRDFFGVAVLVHCAYRPEEYNKLIGGAPKSAHKIGKGCDFHVESLNCDFARDKIILAGLLDRLELRMESKPKSNWVHVDMYPPSVSGGKRFFPV